MTCTELTLLVGSEECLDRECEEYFTEDGEPDSGIERCSHIAEQRVCETHSTTTADGFYEHVSPWPCTPMAADAAAPGGEGRG